MGEEKKSWMKGRKGHSVTGQHGSSQKVPDVPLNMGQNFPTHICPSVSSRIPGDPPCPSLSQVSLKPSQPPPNVSGTLSHYILPATNKTTPVPLKASSQPHQRPFWSRLSHFPNPLKISKGQLTRYLMGEPRHCAHEKSSALCLCNAQILFLVTDS